MGKEQIKTKTGSARPDQGECLMNTTRSKQYERIRQISLSAAICIFCVIVGQIMHALHAPDDSIICVYILAIVLTSAMTSGYVYGIVSAFVMTLAFAFFVSSPVYSFINPSPYLLVTTGIVFVISVLISSITSKVKDGELQAVRREEESKILYHLTRDLAGMTTIQDVIRLTLQNISDVFHTDCRLLLFDEKRKPEETFVLMEHGVIDSKAPTDSTRDFSEYQTKPAKGYYVNAQQYEWPIYALNHRILGAIAIPRTVAEKLSSVDLRMVNTMAEAAGIVLDKLQMAREEERSRIEFDQERYRTNLLRSISHDLRTPLAGICGTAEVLMSMLPADSKEHELAFSINRETNWLYNLVQNILSLTRLQNGTMQIKKELMIVEEVVESAVETMRFRLPSREFITMYPDEILAAPMDASLIKQVIINLLDNANKYSPGNTPIEIEVEDLEDSDEVAVEVRDHGNGLSPAALEKVFRMFYTTKANDPKALRGFGLGLPICDSIMKTHQGSITASNRTDGQSGAVFTIRLPKSHFSSPDGTEI